MTKGWSRSCSAATTRSRSARSAGSPVWAGGVLWLDAHGDLNTPQTSPSGNVHGMPLAAARGLWSEVRKEGLRLPAIDPEHVALVGVRSLDPGEQALVRDLGIAVYTVSDLDGAACNP